MGSLPYNDPMARRERVERPHFSWMTWGMLLKCPRRYFLNAYAFQFEGDFAYDVQAQKKLTFWNAWAGQLADDGISEAIRHFKKHHVWRQDLDQWLKERARVWVQDSYAWRRAANVRDPLPDVETQPIDAYYFNTIPDQAAHLEVLEKARSAVRAWYATDLPSRIESAPAEAIQIRDSGEFPVATHDGVPVYASYDFAIRLRDRITIFDWKTGKITPENAEKALEQLHWYALFAMQVWGYQSSQIRLAPVFLSTNYAYDETEPDPQTLQGIRESWKTRHREIKLHMEKFPNLTDLQECFPMTENLRECASCVFRSCPGFGRIPGTAAV